MTTSTGTFTTGMREIAFSHIPTQTLFPPADAKLVKLNVNVTAKNIGYVVGAGDEVPAALQQMGCRVTLLGPTDLSGSLAGYDAIITGVRAYNTNGWLAAVSAQPAGVRKKWRHPDCAIRDTRQFVSAQRPGPAPAWPLPVQNWTRPRNGRRRAYDVPEPAKPTA